ncbi:MAG: hypothetical protein KIS88_01970 [Anaerolineales bacterium]|nr:hypothetical protein [Anaerolineales bacterium]
MRRDYLGVVLLTLLFLLLQAAPFASAQTSTDSAHEFGGFLLNPTDGFSYLAKMRQGYDGAWSFTLPYTAEPGHGAAINMYYLLLGHVARGLGWSLVFTFHAARLLGAAALCAALYRLMRATLSQSHLWAFAFALFGSGLGWLALLAGGFTSDFWVAEMYPFLAAFANAHFPLGLALQIFLITPADTPRPLAWLLAAALAAVVYPFGWAVAAAVLCAAALLAQLRGPASPQWLQAACVVAGGLPYAAYALFTVTTHPVLAGWNAQNLTPAMPLWDLAVSLSPALLLALPGAYLALRQRERGMQVLAVWLLVCVVMLYLPFGLQRRMSSGLYIPAVGLAVYALSYWLAAAARRRLALILLLLLAVPTNLLILLGSLQASRTQEAALYLHADEAAAYRWLSEHAAPGALLLAPARNSLHAPAFADVRVWYAHPFETVQAEDRQAELQAFFADPAGRAAFLAAHAVDYILWGGDKAVLTMDGWSRVYSSGAVQIWARDAH